MSVEEQMHVPSHGGGKLRPFVAGDPHAVEMARRGGEAKRAKALERVQRAAEEAEEAKLIAEQRREAGNLLRAVGVVEAKRLLADVSMNPRIVEEMARAMAVDVMGRIIAGEFPIKDAAMAVRLVEAGIKISRLEQGLTTDIIEDESAKVQRIRDTVEIAKRRAV